MRARLAEDAFFCLMTTSTEHRESGEVGVFRGVCGVVSRLEGDAVALVDGVAGVAGFDVSLASLAG